MRPFIFLMRILKMNKIYICDKAKMCHSAPACQHAKEHDEKEDCRGACDVGGSEKCVEAEHEKKL